MILLAYILISIVSIYTLWLLIIAIFWGKHEERIQVISNAPVSIIIPFRNEENNLLNCTESIKNQAYEQDKIEIIFVNDHSTDSSAAILSDIPNITLLSLPENLVGKKNAITHGINNAKNEIIITVDADIVADENWLSTMVSKQQQTNAPMVIGQVKLEGINNFTNAIQLLEHFAITIVGGGTAKMNSPILCNGANLLFTKTAFEKVNGYEGNKNIASGDDVFLLNKIKETYPNQIAYLKNTNAAVTCKTETSLNSAIKQRIRWAGKNKHNNNPINAFTGLIIVATNISWPILGLLSVFNAQLTKYFLISLLMKCIIDFLLLFLASSFYRQKKLLWWFPLFFCFYPIELIVIFFSSLVTKQKWKDRIIN
ncbi:MAG: glycosyltransferase [Bacteroidetes bacterium]|nr:glycosyltransferase [Bacteroidota bacterium]